MAPQTVHAGLTRLLATVYTAAADEYARLWGPVIRPMGERLVGAMPLAEATRILDVGAGCGALLPVIRAAASGALVVGVDPADGMLRIARSDSAETPLAVMDAEHLGFAASAFDAAVVAFVLFHLPDPVRGLGEMARVLRSGGLVGTATWGADQLLPASTLWDEALDAAGAKPEIIPETLRQHAWMDSPPKVMALLEAAGLEPVQIWSERFERRWTGPELFTLRSGYGLYRRRLDTLDEERRRRCLERLRTRMTELSRADLVWRPEVIFALARRS